MSHVIVRDRRFVKLPGNRYVPIALYGDNNVTHYRKGREVMALEWGTFSYDDSMIGGTEEEILSYAKSIHQEKEEQCFKFQGRWMDNEGAIHFFENGIKNAMTIEQIRLQKPFIALTCYLSCYGENGFYRELEETVRTTEYLDYWLGLAKARKKEKCNEGRDGVYIRIGYNTSDEIHLMQPFNDDIPVMVKVNKGNYISDIRTGPDGKGYTWSFNSEIARAKVFENSTKFLTILRKYPLREPLRFLDANKEKKKSIYYCGT